MKQRLILAGAGLLLFAASLAGMLGWQGRLNAAGLRDLPLLGSWFATAPADGAGDAPAAPLGQEPMLPYRIAEPVLGGKGEAGATAEEPTVARPAPADPGTRDAAAPTPDEAEFQRRKEAVYGQKQYERGRLFEFPRIEANLSVEEIDRILARARDEMARAQTEREEIKKRSADLDARERDILDRHEIVMQKIQAVEQMRVQLDQQVAEAKGLVLLVRQGELQRFKETARTLAALEPDKASKVLLEWWRTEAGQEQALKTLELMEPDARNALLDALDIAQLRQVIDRRLRVMVEPKPAGGEAKRSGADGR